MLKKEKNALLQVLENDWYCLKTHSHNIIYDKESDTQEKINVL